MKKWCLVELQIKLTPHSSKMSQNKCTRGKQEDYEKVLQYLKEGIHENLTEYWDTMINITNCIIVKISRRAQCALSFQLFMCQLAQKMTSP